MSPLPFAGEMPFFGLKGASMRRSLLLGLLAIVGLAAGHAQTPHSQAVFHFAVIDEVMTSYGGDANVLSGLMEGADAIRGRAFAVDIPEAFRGKGRVIMFAGNPIYRWQNHGEFNMVFNSILNWNDK